MTYALVFRRYAPFKSFGGGFEGDTRTAPSTSPLASARTIDITYFDRTGAGRSIGLSSGTTHTIFGGHGMSKVSTRVSGVIVGLPRSHFPRRPLGPTHLCRLPRISTPSSTFESLSAASSWWLRARSEETHFRTPR